MNIEKYKQRPPLKNGSIGKWVIRIKDDHGFHNVGSIGKIVGFVDDDVYGDIKFENDYHGYTPEKYTLLDPEDYPVESESQLFPV